MPKKPLLFFMLGSVLLTACSSAPQKPVLYPNAKLENVGRPAADQAIAACMAKASDAGVSKNKDGKTAQKAGAGAVIGGVSAGVWGLVRGDALERAAAGALSGAATGAVVGEMDGQSTNPTYKRFVDKCLSDQGYSVIGWE